jgi:beta-lactamase superfamily II metal-dependent hydrolase
MIGCFFSVPCSNVNGSYLVIHNIGQGLMTHVELPSHCLFFDAGGESRYFRAQKISSECSDKNLIFFISHTDEDHISFIQKLVSPQRSACLYKIPIEPLNKKSMQYFRGLQICQNQILQILKPWLEIYEIDSHLKANPLAINTARALESVRKKNHNVKKWKFDTNSVSRIFYIKGRHRSILLTGDSTQAEEKIWSRDIPGPVDYFILGHHGSKTSTGTILLNEIKKKSGLHRMIVGVASQRRKKYGHPHPLVVERLKENHVPLLITEKWNNIKIEL